LRGLGMPELRRLGSPIDAGAATDLVVADAAERDRRIEALLVQGLDLYFAGSHADAIHVWTRVLFLDRSHARARAYIDRARSAAAERQRKSDELVQTSQQLLERGETRAARDLLTQAVAVAGEDERAAAVRMQLERVERAHAASDLSAPVHEVVPGWKWPRRSPRLTWIAGVGAAALFLAILAAGLTGWIGSTAADDHLARSRAPERLPVLSSADAALIRARTFYGRGRLAEALQALDAVSDRSPRRPEADKMRIEIERLLLATRQAGRASSGGRAQ